MRAEAVAFLRTLTPEQRRAAVFGIDSHERLDWDYVPRERAGLPLKAMDGRQRAAAHALLRAALSDAGYRKATDIMRLEEVLRAIERVRRFDRDPDNYKWILFGDPEVGAPWGWRVEGHHLSLNFTFAAGSTGAVTPAFMGANPARVPSGPLGGFRILGAQEDLVYLRIKRGWEPAKAATTPVRKGNYRRAPDIGTMLKPLEDEVQF